MICGIQAKVTIDPAQIEVTSRSRDRRFAGNCELRAARAGRHSGADILDLANNSDSFQFGYSASGTGAAPVQGHLPGIPVKYVPSVRDFVLGGNMTGNCDEASRPAFCPLAGASAYSCP